MEIDKIIAICGVSCTKCESYQATIQGDINKQKLIAFEWSKSMGRDFTVNDILCDGCRADGKYLSAYFVVLVRSVGVQNQKVFQHVRIVMRVHVKKLSPPSRKNH